MYTQKITKRYSSAIKAEALSSIGSGLLSKSEAAILYGVTAATIHQWIRRSGRTTLLNKVINIQMPNEVDIIKELTAQKQRLESALAHATLKIITLESTIKVLEEETGTMVKKSTGAGSSNTLLPTQSSGEGT